MSNSEGKRADDDKCLLVRNIPLNFDESKCKLKFALSGTVLEYFQFVNGRGCGYATYRSREDCEKVKLHFTNTILQICYKNQAQCDHCHQGMKEAMWCPCSTRMFCGPRCYVTHLQATTHREECVKDPAECECLRGVRYRYAIRCVCHAMVWCSFPCVAEDLERHLFDSRIIERHPLSRSALTPAAANGGFSPIEKLAEGDTLGERGSDPPVFPAEIGSTMGKTGIGFEVTSSPAGSEEPQLLGGQGGGKGSSVLAQPPTDDESGKEAMMSPLNIGRGGRGGIRPLFKGNHAEPVVRSVPLCGSGFGGRGGYRPTRPPSSLTELSSSPPKDRFPSPELSRRISQEFNNNRNSNVKLSEEPKATSEGKKNLTAVRGEGVAGASAYPHLSKMKFIQLDGIDIANRVQIVYAADLDLFYVLPEDDLDEIILVNASVDQYVNDCDMAALALLPPPTKDSLVVAKFEGEWFRGVVREISGGVALIFFFDYGNAADTPLCEVLPLPTSVLKTFCRTFPVELQDSIPTMEKAKELEHCSAILKFLKMSAKYPGLPVVSFNDVDDKNPLDD